MSRSMGSAANAQSVVDRRRQGSDHTDFRDGLPRPANRRRGGGSTARQERAPVAYLVTEPGTTSLLARQLLNEDGLAEAKDRFGPTTFTVRPLGDILDDWLTAPIAERAPIDALARLMVLEVLLRVGTPQQAPVESVVAEAGGATMADLCRQAVARIERLGRLRDAGAPETVRRTERRMLRAAARGLLIAAATKFPPRMESSA